MGKKTQEETIKKANEAEGMAGRSILPLPTYLHSEAESSGKSLLILSVASSNATTQTTGITNTSSRSSTT